MERDYNIIKQALERLERLEIENRNNEKVIADGVKLMNRNLELQSRLETLEKENIELQLQLEQLENSAKIRTQQADEYATTLKEKYLDLKQENQDLWQQIENYNHKFAEVERKKADLIQENEKWR